jgi:hypothetical protein
MNRIALALGSFIVGACCGSIALSLIHTSTRVQASQGEVVGFAGPPGEPAVPPIRTHIRGGGVLGGTVQSLDGVECDGCTLGVGRLSYAGGAYELKNAQIPRGIPIELKGAALNTVNLLTALGALPSRQQPIPAPKTQPKNRADELEIKPQSSFTLVSLEGVKK